MALIIPSPNALAFGSHQKKLELRVCLCDQSNMNNKERTPFDDLPESALRLLLPRLLQQNEELLHQVAGLQSELAELRWLLFGRKSERVEPVERKIRQKQESRRKRPKPQRKPNAKSKEKKSKLSKRSSNTRHCPMKSVCQGSEFHPLGTGQESIEYEDVAEHTHSRIDELLPHRWTPLPP
jgi:hypothetical protein